MKKKITKLFSCFLAILLLLGSLVSSAATIASNYSANTLTEEKISKLVKTIVENQQQIPYCIVPENSSITTFKGFQDKGEISLNLDLTPMNLDAGANILLKYDLTRPAYELQLLLTLKGEQALYLEVYYTDSSKLIIRCPELLGEGKTYGILLSDPDAMLDKFAASEIAKALGISKENIETIKENELWQALASGDISKRFADFINAYSNFLDAANTLEKELILSSEPQVTEEKYVVGEKEYDVYAVKMTYKNEDWQNFLDTFITEYNNYLNAVGALFGLEQTVTKEISAQYEALLSSFEFDGEDIYYIDKKTGELLGSSAEASMNSLMPQLPFNYKFEADGQYIDSISGTLSIYEKNMPLDLLIEYVFTMEEKQDKVVWNANFGITSGETSIALDGAFTFDEAKEQYLLNITIPMPMNGQILDYSFNAVGKLSVKPDSLDISISECSVYSPEMTVTAYNASTQEQETITIPESKQIVPIPEISFSYKSGCDIQAPRIYSDLFSLSEDEAYALIARLSLNAHKLSQKFSEDMYVSTASDPKVKKYYAISYDDYEMYADQYTKEEFEAMVDEYVYRVNIGSSY